MSHWQVSIFIIFITFYLENFNANVAIMMKLWDIATSNQGGRGLASFVGTMNWEGIWPSHKNIESDALCQVWLKMAQWFDRRRVLKVLNVFLLFHNYLPFEKGVALKFILKTWISFIQGCFVPSLVEVGPYSGSEEDF